MEDSFYATELQDLSLILLHKTDESVSQCCDSSMDDRLEIKQSENACYLPDHMTPFTFPQHRQDDWADKKVKLLL